MGAWEATYFSKQGEGGLKLLSRTGLSATPWTVACQAPPSVGLTESNALMNPLSGLGGGTKGKSNLGGNQSGLHKGGVSSHRGRKGKLLFVLDSVCLCVCVFM